MTGKCSFLNHLEVISQSLVNSLSDVDDEGNISLTISSKGEARAAQALSCVQSDAHKTLGRIAKTAPGAARITKKDAIGLFSKCLRVLQAHGRVAIRQSTEGKLQVGFRKRG